MYVCVLMRRHGGGQGVAAGQFKGGDKGTEERTKETNFSPITHLL